MVFSEEFFLNGIANMESVFPFFSFLSFFNFPFFYFLASPMNLKAFRIQYLTIYSLVFLSFKNFPNNVLKTNSNWLEF